MRTLPGHLPSDQVDALLEPFADFEAFVADMTSIRIVTELTELTREGHTIRAFNYINSMGSGGGAFYGESGFRILTAELHGASRAATLVKRKGLGARLRHLFSGKVKVDGPRSFNDAFFVVSDDADGARGALPPEFLAHLGRHRPDVDIELRGHHLVAWRRGAAKEAAQLGFIDEMAVLVPLCERPGYRH
ncbi:MAG: hypothetical protein DRJ42_08850 [Deltaproteobacteria bacterium]|nr:MAG: hypothetical protein DRJ42_08850 [Deltaproteobacteria bacterium]